MARSTTTSSSLDTVKNNDASANYGATSIYNTFVEATKKEQNSNTGISSEFSAAYLRSIQSKKRIKSGNIESKWYYVLHNLACLNPKVQPKQEGPVTLLEIADLYESEKQNRRKASMYVWHRDVTKKGWVLVARLLSRLDIQDTLATAIKKREEQRRQFREEDQIFLKTENNVISGKAVDATHRTQRAFHLETEKSGESRKDRSGLENGPVPVASGLQDTTATSKSSLLGLGAPNGLSVSSTVPTTIDMGSIVKTSLNTMTTSSYHEKSATEEASISTMTSTQSYVKRGSKKVEVMEIKEAASPNTTTTSTSSDIREEFYSNTDKNTTVHENTKRWYFLIVNKVTTDRSPTSRDNFQSRIPQTTREVASVQRCGPVTEHVLQSLLQKRLLSGKTFVWCAGMASWKRLCTISAVWKSSYEVERDRSQKNQKMVELTVGSPLLQEDTVSPSKGMHIENTKEGIHHPNNQGTFYGTEREDHTWKQHLLRYTGKEFSKQ